MNDIELLLKNLNQIHTTKLGVERIKNNLNIKTNDVVDWCINKINDNNCLIVKKGKNFYASIDDYIITINSSSYTIITAHKINIY